jgi:hypothetical protein
MKMNSALPPPWRQVQRRQWAPDPGLVAWPKVYREAFEAELARIEREGTSPGSESLGAERRRPRRRGSSTLPTRRGAVGRDAAGWWGRDTSCPALHPPRCQPDTGHWPRSRMRLSRRRSRQRRNASRGWVSEIAHSCQPSRRPTTPPRIGGLGQAVDPTRGRWPRPPSIRRSEAGSSGKRGARASERRWGTLRGCLDDAPNGKGPRKKRRR